MIGVNKLSDNEISSLLFNEFALSTIVPALMKQILETSRGNPGSAVSYLRKLKDMKMLVIDEAVGSCKLKDPESLSKFVSDDIKIKATQIYDNVDAKNKYILQLAATTGNTIPIVLLKEVRGARSEDVYWREERTALGAKQLCYMSSDDRTC